MLPPEEIKQIAIFRALQLGDMLCTIPAIRALKNAYPNAHLTLIGLPWAQSFVERFSHYFTSFLWFPGYPGLPEQSLNPYAFNVFLDVIHNAKFDLALQMQGNGTIVNPIVALFQAKYTGGFYKRDNYLPKGDLYLEYPNYGPEIDRHLMLMKKLGVEPAGKELEFPISEADVTDLNLADLQVEPGKYVCIHPGSRGISRQWSPAYFAKLADLAVEAGYKAVITGTKSELDIVEKVKSAMKYEPVIAAGKTSLGAIAVLIRDAHALISNCTGVSHIAAALQTKSIIISLHGEAERWSPLNSELHRTIDRTKTPDIDLVYRVTENLLKKEKLQTE